MIFKLYLQYDHSSMWFGSTLCWKIEISLLLLVISYGDPQFPKLLIHTIVIHEIIVESYPSISFSTIFSMEKFK